MKALAGFESRSDLSAETKQRILGNATRLYKLPRTAPALAVS